MPSGRFQASFVAPNGVRVKAELTFDRREEAETWLAAQRTDLARSTWRAPTVGSSSLRRYAVSWLEQRGDLRPSTAELYEQKLRLHILPVLGDTSIRELTPPMVRRWFADLADTTGPVSRSQCYRIPHTIMNQAVSDGEITSNPCNIRGASSVKTAERPAPTLPQVHALAELVPSRYSALVLAAAYSGLRFGELTARTRADVTIPGSGLPEFRVVKGIRRVQRKWLVSDRKTQAGVRVVSLPEFLGPVPREHVDTYVGRGDTSLVFATKSGRESPTA